MTPDPVERPVREYTQQPRLQVGGHVADLVEKQGAAACLSKTAVVMGNGARERVFLVPEKLGFHLFRNGSGADRDERAVGTGAVLVHCPRDQFLAGTRFAGDEHGDVRGRKAGQPSFQ